MSTNDKSIVTKVLYSRPAVAAGEAFVRTNNFVFKLMKNRKK